MTGLMRLNLLAAAVAAALGVFGASAHAEGPPTFIIVIQDHRFEPAEVEVPAGERIKLVIENRDSTAEEVESLDLRREKIIAGGASATIWVGPLPPGEYGFFGEFHEDTAQVKLIAK